MNSLYFIGDEDGRGSCVWGYQPDNELFSSYLERVELFFAANTIPDDKQVPVFLGLVDGKTYSLLKNLIAPALLKEKGFVELVGVLKKHFEPRPLVIAERFHLSQKCG